MQRQKRVEAESPEWRGFRGCGLSSGIFLGLRFRFEFKCLGVGVGETGSITTRQAKFLTFLPPSSLIASQTPPGWKLQYWWCSTTR